MDDVRAVPCIVDARACRADVCMHSGLNLTLVAWHVSRVAPEELRRFIPRQGGPLCAQNMQAALRKASVLVPWNLMMVPNHKVDSLTNWNASQEGGRKYALLFGRLVDLCRGFQVPRQSKYSKETINRANVDIPRRLRLDYVYLDSGDVCMRLGLTSSTPSANSDVCDLPWCRLGGLTASDSIQVTCRPTQ